MAKATRIPRVAILVEASRANGRDLLEGIGRYVHQHGPWSIYHHERTLRDCIPPWMNDWDGDGILARIETAKDLRRLWRKGLPMVDLFSWHSPPGVPAIRGDQEGVARLAAEHLLERGFRRFAFCGFAGVHYSEERCECFVRYLEERGYEASVYGRRKAGSRRRVSRTEATALSQEDDLGTWLCGLPKPVGLMACNDIRGQQVLNACTERGIAVPDEVAVIGVDNDVLLCQLSLPSLSSVELDVVGAGYEAARMLDQLMHGRRRVRDGIVRSLGVVVRQSTNSVASTDKDLVAAVQFIREHAFQGIEADDVVTAVCLSRSTLERRFSDVLDRSVTAEIVRVKLERVKELLARTDWPLWRIARDAGFPHIEPLCRLFKRKTGLTPGAFRKRSSRTSS